MGMGVAMGWSLTLEVLPEEVGWGGVGWVGGGSRSLQGVSPLQETGLCADFHPSGRVVAVGLNTGR